METETQALIRANLFLDLHNLTNYEGRIFTIEKLEGLLNELKEYNKPENNGSPITHFMLLPSVENNPENTNKFSVEIFPLKTNNDNSISFVVDGTGKGALLLGEFNNNGGSGGPGAAVTPPPR